MADPPPAPASSSPQLPNPSNKKKRGRRGGKGRRAAASLPFHDLCVELPQDGGTVEQVRELSRRLAALGYGVVAWNETVSGREGVRQLERAAKKKRAGGGAGGALWLATQGPGTPARQLRRVTVVVDDPGDAQFLSGALRGLRSQGAEVVAARPTTDRVLTFLCESADVDVISVDVRGGRAGFALTAKQAERAIARGLVFEIQYAGAIEESAAAQQAQQSQHQQQQQQRRQQVLANIAAIVTATRGRGLVWSSGAGRVEWLRGPHDVMNLAVVLGLKEHQALSALTSAADAAIGHAEARCLEWLPVQVLAPAAAEAARAEGMAPMEEEGDSGGSEKLKKKKKKLQQQRKGGGATVMET